MSQNAQLLINGPTTTSGSPRSVTFALNNPVWAELVSAYFTFVADATPGQRMINVDVVDAGGHVVMALTAMPLDPSQTVSMQMSHQDNPGNNTVTGQSIARTLIPPGASIKCVDVNNRASSADSIAANVVIDY